MIKHLTLLLFIGSAWGQDEYAYFSDMEKQLEFEQKKIVVKRKSVFCLWDDGQNIN